MLEIIIDSIDFEKNEVNKARSQLNAHLELSEQIVELAERLADTLKQQQELFEYSEFQKSDYQSIDDMFTEAGNCNMEYKYHTAPLLSSLMHQYESKYWPTRSELVRSIATFEKLQTQPTHRSLPDSVLLGKASIKKDFVIAFDKKIRESRHLATFKLSNKAMVEIITVIQNLDPDDKITEDTIRVIRNRNKNL